MLGQQSGDLARLLSPIVDATKQLMYINLLNLGRVPYSAALALQQQVVAARKQNLIGDTLLMVEHPPVLTLGRNAHRSNVLARDEELAQRGVELHEVNRGGDVTYHGPGQLVGYPIIDLRGDLPGKKDRISARSTMSVCLKRS
ncbi:lipoyl protein ligase domain-containing protein [Tunturiibacter gelidiferens]|uniref:lipoyl protein ligase domain-containing protein n=1 Tax=Tunturiibacter gelidiferens TaxID=3069689 RepID=UPI003D9BAD7F